MLALIRREPALVTGLVLALIGVVSAFGLHISDDQKAAVVALVGSVLAIVGAVQVRSQVTPTPKPKRTQVGAIDPLYALVVVILAVVLVWLLASVVH